MFKETADDIAEPAISDENSDFEDFLFEQSEVSKEFSQKEVSDLVRDLGLSKQNSMLLASRLKSKNVLSVGTKVNFYQNREKELRRYFSREDQVVFCNNVSGLLKSMGLEVYKPEDWRLFIGISINGIEVDEVVPYLAFCFFHSADNCLFFTHGYKKYNV